MKNLSRFLLVLIQTVFIVACDKNVDSPETVLTQSSNQTKNSLKITSNYACGAYMDGFWATPNNFHVYTGYTIDVSAEPVGRLVGLTVTVDDVPNRFTVKDETGTTVAASSDIYGNVSGWLGQASYTGPWGASINAVTTGTLYFYKTSSASSFTLTVETQTNATNSDHWSAGVYCYNPTGDPIGGTGSTGCSPFSYWFPNTFTPNSDGFNDDFKLYDSAGGVGSLQASSVEVTIFNRWGAIVYGPKVISAVSPALLNGGLILWPNSSASSNSAGQYYYKTVMYNRCGGKRDDKGWLELVK